jgi:hypothetical protein
MIIKLLVPKRIVLIVSGTNEITIDEMEKSMIIFKLKRGIMPILSWGLVKTNH